MGNVFNIQRFSTHDGPGIRTTFFLMGCSLQCRWCHNPEGLYGNIQLQYNEKDCIRCGTCVGVCKQKVHELEDSSHQVNFKQCTLCGNCIQQCHTGALQTSGKEYSSKELALQGSKDILFYKNNGGVTFSGGEPLLQAAFVAETAKLCKVNGVPTVAIDTAGNVEWNSFETVLPWVDYFLYDIKVFSEKNHILGTGYSNRKILENLYRLDKTGKKIFIRIPLIPSINDSQGEIKGIISVLEQLKNVVEVRVLPYHTFGRDKFTTLGYELPKIFTIPKEDKVNAFQNVINEKIFKNYK